GFFNRADPDGSSSQIERYRRKSPEEIARDLDGALFIKSKIRFGQITDGASNTLLLAELILAEDQRFNDLRGRYYNPAHGNVFFSTKYPPNSSEPDQLSYCSEDVTPPQAPCITRSNGNGTLFLTARSYHPGGVDACRADGSCDFVTSDIDFLAYKSMGSRDGGEFGGSVN
ncbi:MAG: DUF1559 domain-containing protein, partial [Planctomycetales bacterium]|nr:DUF1559 domain-containing protein [Planctomycetales bacterium]